MTSEIVNPLKGLKVEFVFCHRKPERSFFWKGKQFPICARCTGVYLGYLSFPFFTFCVFNLSWFWSVFLLLPTIIDGLTQLYFKRESNNFLRVTTGIIAGIGLMSIVALIGQFLGKEILLTIK